MIAVALPRSIARRPAEAVAFEFGADFGFRFVIEEDLKPVFGNVVHDFPSVELELRQTSRLFGFLDFIPIADNLFDSLLDASNFRGIVGKLPALDAQVPERFPVSHETVRRSS